MIQSLIQLHDYFHVLASDDIRIKGTRISIEQILYEYLYNHQSPEEIQKHFTTVTLEQIYATILYYFRNQEQVSAYLENWLTATNQAETEHDQNPPTVVKRLLKLKAEQEAVKVSQECP
ncbi:hypothetical protein PCC7805_02583 [Planktothrix agardhii]|jgi:uncharacterized protein (DUF433 family)|uniref:DUF433 domain-containing protein n=1 Tax=Planktothrix agardhii TaxID=1160 RepID=A0A1J1JF39_PLAAG|nr:hypothetical protein PCC7805_02583 [Planktothrix agardhii]CUM59741.1 conserved protein of unknown function [Planktothrix agardhii]